MASEACKLLDNGWKILLFKTGLGDYGALAIPQDESVDVQMLKWQNHEDRFEEDETDEEFYDKAIFGGINRYCTSHFTPEEALNMLTEKVLFRRLPPIEKKKRG